MRGVSDLMQQTSFAAIGSVLKYMRRTRNTLLALCPDEVVAALQGGPVPAPYGHWVQQSAAAAAGLGTRASLSHRFSASVIGAGTTAPPALVRDSMGVAAGGSGTGTGAAGAQFSWATAQAARAYHARSAGAAVHALHSGGHGPLRALSAGYGAVLANVNRELSVLSAAGIARQLPSVLVGGCCGECEAVGLGVGCGVLAQSRSASNRLVPYLEAKPFTRIQWYGPHEAVLHYWQSA